MSENNFIRFFVILSEKEKLTEAEISPSGYCKVEGFGSKVIFTFSIRNLAYAENGYKVYAVMKEKAEAILLGRIKSNTDGIVYENIQSDINEVFGGKNGLAQTEALYILTDMNVCVMCGYTNRNISMSQRAFCETKLENVISKAETDDNDEKGADEYIDIDKCLTMEEEEFSADENSGYDSLVAEEAVNNESEETDTEENQNSLSNYIQTFTKLYEGITGVRDSLNANSKNTEDKQNISEESAEEAPKIQTEVSDEEKTYWSMTKDYYSKLIETEEEVVPFDFLCNNTKWVLTVPYNTECVNSNILIGLIYDNESVRYIANGTPVYANGVVNAVSNAMWLPAKKNRFGIVGYWVTFIDAKTGILVNPEMKLL